MRRPTTKRTAPRPRIAPGKVALAVLWALTVLSLATYAGRLAYANTPMGGSGEGLALGLDAKLMRGAGSKTFDKATERALTKAVREAPLNARYVRLLSLAAAEKGEAERSRQLLYLADRISRRDLLTQLGMVEDAVQRDRIGEALDHYEIALTTSERADDIIFPVLAGALDDVQIRNALSTRIRRNNPWRERFLSYAVTSVPPRAVAPLLVQWRDDRAMMQLFQAKLLDSYVAKKDYDGAFIFAAHIGRSAASAFGLGFSTDTLDPKFGPLSWQFARDNGIEAAAEKNRVAIYLTPDSRGTVAARLLQLAPGHYVFSQLLSSSGGTDTNLSWNWECLRGAVASQIATIKIPAGRGRVPFRAEIDIPQNCSAVRTSLTVTTDSYDGQPELVIESIGLVRA